MALSPGDTLSNNHYRIIRQLGRGGFGFVYLAQDTLLGEQVAIKELIPALVGDEAMLKRFLAEARATMRLSHSALWRPTTSSRKWSTTTSSWSIWPAARWTSGYGRRAPCRWRMWLVDQILDSGAGIQTGERAILYFPGDDLLAALRPRGLPIGNLTGQYRGSLTPPMAIPGGCASGCLPTIRWEKDHPALALYSYN